MDVNSEVLNMKMDKGLISSTILLGNAKLLDESSRNSAAFLDLYYFPFYYHLGSQIAPENVLQIGSVAGLQAMCFLRSCKTVKYWTALYEADGFLPVNIIRSNITSYLKGICNIFVGNIDFLNEKVSDKAWDLSILSSPFKDMNNLNLLWKYLKPGGLLLADYINDDECKEVFDKFCKIKNRQPVFFRTRYGTGIIER